MASVSQTPEQDKFEVEFAKVLGYLANIAKHCKLLLDAAVTWESEAAAVAAAAAATPAPASGSGSGSAGSMAAAMATSTLVDSAKRHCGRVTHFVRVVEDDTSASASILTYLRHQHRRRREELRQIKVMSNPQLHVPSRRTKIIAQPLAQNVSFEQLRQLAKAKSQGGKPPVQPPAGPSAKMATPEQRAEAHRKGTAVLQAAADSLVLGPDNGGIATDQQDSTGASGGSNSAPAVTSVATNGGDSGSSPPANKRMATVTVVAGPATGAPKPTTGTATAPAPHNTSHHLAGRPAQPSVRTLRARRAKRSRPTEAQADGSGAQPRNVRQRTGGQGNTGDCDGSTTSGGDSDLQIQAKTAAATAALAAEHAPKHPNRTEAQQQEKLQRILMQELGDGNGAAVTASAQVAPST